MNENTTLLGRPGVQRGAYPERVEPHHKLLDRLLLHARRACHRRRSQPRFLRRFVSDVAGHGPEYHDLKSRETITAADELRLRLRKDGFRGEAVARTFALVREVADRTLHERHYDVQLIGGWVLLQGMVAEMDTGEGKTLTATLAAATAALAGVPVHIITVNDYLAKRDARWTRPIYEALGLSVGVVVQGMDGESRREAYSRDVTYCTNKDLAFDYLRDRILLRGKPSHLHLQLERLSGGSNVASQLVLRGLHFGIVDEADSVLIDEARTPLIISSSRSPVEERRAYEAALNLADKLKPGRHFKVVRQEGNVELTAAGRGKLEELGRALGGVWARRQSREDLVHHALMAKRLFVRDQHYLVKDGKVQIIDEYTGRTMPDRSWEHGLHQVVEAKEGCPLTPQTRALARTSYQRVFQRYLRLAGMTGTAREVASELGSVYDLAVVRVPTNRPLNRRPQPNRVYRSAQEKWKAVVARVEDIHRTGRPILIGTRSVEVSEHLSCLLRKARLQCQVLNARQDGDEAQIIARAGERGRITVATNMAGRGTDIQLEPGVAKLGGLDVIATEFHDSRRIDRQLFGRCGRQGDPGSYEAIVSLEDELITVYVPRLKRLFPHRRRAPDLPIPRCVATFLFRLAQRGAERCHGRMRRDLLRMDEYLETTLAFSGMSE